MACNENKLYQDDKRKNKIPGANNKKEIVINSVVPHGVCDKIEVGTNYIGVMIYKKSGLSEGTCQFIIVKSDKAVKAARNCKRQTPHAGAYYLAFGRGPEKEPDNSLVAGGFSIQRGQPVFNSLTFNDMSREYLDADYYKGTAKVMGKDEQQLVRQQIKQNI